MSADNKDGQHSSADFTNRKSRARRKGVEADDLGKALRSAYDEALKEEVPDDFRDLLGKLS